MIEHEVYRKIKRMIYRGRLRPGDRLVERDLANKLGISRNPLRASLTRLESDGLVRSVPNSATYVADFTPSDLYEIYSMRLLLEPLATRLATGCGGTRLVSRLRQLCRKMTQHTRSGNMRKLDEVDYQFHWTIVQASGHKRLIHAYERSHIQIISWNDDYLRAMPPNATAAGHEGMLLALEQGRAADAERAAYEHVLPALRIVQQQMNMSVQQDGRREKDARPPSDPCSQTADRGAGHGKPCAKVKESQPDVLERIRQFLDRAYAQPLTLAAVAERTRYSPNYLDALFSRWTGQGICAYLIRCRMEQAMRLCCETQLSFQVIANCVGYQDPLYFSRLFRRYYGRSPTQARLTYIDSASNAPGHPPVESQSVR